MKSPFLQSVKDCGVGLLVATTAVILGFSMQSPQATMGLREILIYGLCCAIVIAIFGLPISYAARRTFARSSTVTRPIISGIIGFVLSQVILVLTAWIFISTKTEISLESIFSILYLKEWRALTAAFALTGAVIGALSLINKEAEQVGDGDAEEAV